MKRDALGVLALAVAVRGVVFLEARDAPFWTVPLVDESAYLDLARRLLAHAAPAHGAWYVAPGYAYVLAGLMALGANPATIKLLQLVAGATSAWLVWRIGRQVAGRVAAGIAAGMFAIAPVALLQELLLLKTSFATLAVLAALDRLLPDRTAAGVAPGRRWCAAALWLAAATLLRGELVLVGVALAGAGLVARARRWPGAPVTWGPVAIVVGLAIAIALPTLQNRAWSGDPVPFAFGGGTNFYIGNHAGADGSYVPLRPDRFDPAQEEADAVQLASLGLGHAARPSEVTRYWSGQGWAWWRDQPAAAARLFVRKVGLLCGPWELADVLSTAEAGRWVRGLRNPLCGPALILPLAFVGLFATRRRRELWPLHVALGASAAAIVPFFLFERFRLHVVALAVPFAAAGCERAFVHWRARAWRPVAAGSIAVAAFAGLTSLARVPRDPVVLRVNTGEMFFQAGRYDEALREFEAVRAASPDAWRVDINIANTEAARGRIEPALAALGRVLRALHAEAARTGLPSSEELLYCHELAGDLEHDRERLDVAARHYEAALVYAPAAARPALQAKLAACRTP